MNKTLLPLLLWVGLMSSGTQLVWAQPFQTVSAAGITLNYRVTDEPQNLECQLIATTTGWVAVGFAPTQQMQNANFIIGYHNAGNTFIRDDFGTSTSTHASDTSLGGQNNIVLSSSTESGGITQLNFKIPLNSGDIFDKVLTVGQTYSIILGRGFNGSDSFTSGHAAVGSASITIPQPVSNSDGTTPQPVNALSLRVYPNPFRHSFSYAVEGKTDSPAIMELFNHKGQLISSRQASGSSGQFTVEAYLPAGIYYLKVSTPYGLVRKKLVKL
jgi:hypothetical protein